MEGRGLPLGPKCKCRKFSFLLPEVRGPLLLCGMSFPRPLTAVAQATAMAARMFRSPQGASPTIRFIMEATGFEYHYGFYVDRAELGAKIAVFSGPPGGEGNVPAWGVVGQAATGPCWLTQERRR